jgi:hypothetical protein
MSLRGSGGELLRGAVTNYIQVRELKIFSPKNWLKMAIFAQTTASFEKV